MSSVAASDHKRGREGEILDVEGRRGHLLVQVRPPGAQHLDAGLGSVHAIRPVYREKDPRPGPVPLVKSPCEVGQVSVKDLGHPGVAATFHVIEDLEGHRLIPHFLGMAAKQASQKG